MVEDDNLLAQAVATALVKQNYVVGLCQVVRNHPYRKFLPVLFLVDNLSADIVEQIFASGADDCANKIIKQSQLITRTLNRIKRR
ncbi:hypothetical protein [Anabaena lutea]|uniref:Response regulatory domain-containing protein n=1 Tax=Anabaena lutea FACHB-196 TaxID=2692881 RepID=A0ABR8FA43_9NOST|nr:hypothetical protein [Anabaena lutea]MBD2566624.1 hypothetical protein [Anabaena lutea FACHB-196]